jgi:hypothetical protein
MNHQHVGKKTRVAPSQRDFNVGRYCLPFELECSVFSCLPTSGLTALAFVSRSTRKLMQDYLAAASELHIDYDRELCPMAFWTINSICAHCAHLKRLSVYRAPFLGARLAAQFETWLAAVVWQNRNTLESPPVMQDRESWSYPAIVTAAIAQCKAVRRVSAFVLF